MKVPDGKVGARRRPRSYSALVKVADGIARQHKETFDKYLVASDPAVRMKLLDRLNAISRRYTAAKDRAYGALLAEANREEPVLKVKGARKSRALRRAVGGLKARPEYGEQYPVPKPVRQPRRKAMVDDALVATARKAASEARQKHDAAAAAAITDAEAKRIQREQKKRDAAVSGEVGHAKRQPTLAERLHGRGPAEAAEGGDDHIDGEEEQE